MALTAPGGMGTLCVVQLCTVHLSSCKENKAQGDTWRNREQYFRTSVLLQVGARFETLFTRFERVRRRFWYSLMYVNVSVSVLGSQVFVFFFFFWYLKRWWDRGDTISSVYIPTSALTLEFYPYSNRY